MEKGYNKMIKWFKKVLLNWLFSNKEEAQELLFGKDKYVFTGLDVGCSGETTIMLCSVSKGIAKIECIDNIRGYIEHQAFIETMNNLKEYAISYDTLMDGPRGHPWERHMAHQVIMPDNNGGRLYKRCEPEDRRRY